MKILYFSEYNLGGGAKSSLNLAISASKFANVAFLGINHSSTINKALSMLDVKAKKSISIRYLLDFWRYINTFNPDIVHATGMYTGLISLLVRSVRQRKYKIIMTLRHTSTKFRFHFIAKKLVTFLNKVDVIHYLTNYQRQQYLCFGLNPLVYYIIPNIVFIHSYSNTDVSDLRKKLLFESSSNWLIISIGRLVESKQLDVFIETIKKINQLGFNVGGIIVGTGNKSYIKKLKDLSIELGVDSKIVFTGFSEQPELYIKSSDFCLFPTIWDEGLPRFIIEAFSQQKTLVVSNHSSIIDIVKDHYDTLVVNKHSPEIYAQKCIELLVNPELLKQLERGAGYKYNENFEEEKVINEYKRMYYEIMKY